MNRKLCILRDNINNVWLINSMEIDDPDTIGRIGALDFQTNLFQWEGITYAISHIERDGYKWCWRGVETMIGRVEITYTDDEDFCYVNGTELTKEWFFDIHASFNLGNALLWEGVHYRVTELHSTPTTWRYVCQRHSPEQVEDKKDAYELTLLQNGQTVGFIEPQGKEILEQLRHTSVFNVNSILMKIDMQHPNPVFTLRVNHGEEVVIEYPVDIQSYYVDGVIRVRGEVTDTLLKDIVLLIQHPPKDDRKNHVVGFNNMIAEVEANGLIDFTEITTGNFTHYAIKVSTKGRD